MVMYAPKHTSHMGRADELLAMLREATAEFCVDRQMGVLFSGGIDSTLVAALAAETVPVRLYTIGLPGAHDLQVAEETASRLGLEWRPLVLQDREVIDSLLPLSRIIGKTSPLPLSFEMPLYLVCQRGEDKAYLSGQGADELFGGYMRYLSLPEDMLRISMQRDLEELLGNGASMERSIAQRYGRSIGHPYLSRKVVAMASNLPLTDCVRQGARKAILRDVAALLGLDFLVDREKKAAQYGSGVMKVMKAEARRRGVLLGDLVADISARGERVKGEGILP
jgi:asparagine synthase (glutamine-hydrolysing)